jgi:hypothetical protein
VSARSGDRLRRRAPIVLAFLALLVVAGGSLAWVLAAEDPLRPAIASDGSVTDERFALVDVGMRPSEVRDLLGTPDRETTSLAEGLVWPEPEDTCWYYGSGDRAREYQVCFVDDSVITRGSYLVPGSDE